MGRPALTERRKAQTRREIAEHALELFMRRGFDAVGVEAIAEVSGVSLRTFYRYFSTKEEVLAPIVDDGVGELVERLAARPDDEPLGVALERAVEQIAPRLGQPGVAALAGLIAAVPALRARWYFELGVLEETLIPVLRRRSGGDLADIEVRMSAAVIVLCLRVALQAAAETPSTPFPEALQRAVGHARLGAGLALRTPTAAAGDFRSGGAPPVPARGAAARDT